MRTSRVAALALVVGLYFVGLEVLVGLAEGQPANLLPRLKIVLCFWLAWAILTPAVLFAVRRWRSPLIQTAVGIILSMVQTAIALTLQSIGRSGGLRFGLVPFLWGTFTAIVFYALVRYRILYVAADAELTRSKLEMLRSQLRPHFLFNTLNAISVFVTEDAEKAQTMLLRLSTLLRRSLDEEAHEVPLEQELGFVNDYLDIQRGRFGDQLVVTLAVDPAVMRVQVPVFLLQPLLENAIEHGKCEDRPTMVRLSAGRDGDMLRITIADNGPGVGNGGPVREGVGLKNTRARLSTLYGPRASVEVGNGQLGARVDIRVPLQ
jgi:two-component system, LytTR family, sensor kinase